jgi:prepilin-type N-terminal cleavage/methylation domain-containing protein
MVSRLSPSKTDIMNKLKNQAFTLIELLVVIAIIAVLASIAIPVMGQAQERALRTKCLSQARGIFPALKMFAGDHEGSYPSRPDQDEGNQSSTGGGGGGDLKDANEAYANLIPAYVSNETPFGNSASKYCKDKSGGNRGPDNDISTRNKVLEVGENTYAYVRGLSETSNASYPIIADGFAQGSESDPKYSKKEGDYGAQWKGKYAIVVRCDGSATVENVHSQTLKVLRKGQGQKNLFKEESSDNDPWLIGCKVLNPRS